MKTTVPVMTGGKSLRICLVNSHDDRDQTAHQNRAGDRGDALAGARDRLHTGQIGKADAENDRKP